MSNINSSNNNLNSFQSSSEEILHSKLNINQPISHEEESEIIKVKPEQKIAEILNNSRRRYQFFSDLQDLERGPYSGRIFSSCVTLVSNLHIYLIILHKYTVKEQFKICVYIAKIFCYGRMDDKALYWLEKAGKIYDTMAVDEEISSFVLRYLHMTGDVMCRVGRYKESKSYLEKSREFWEGYFPKDEESESWYYVNCGNLELSQKNFVGALIYYEKSREIRERLDKPYILALVNAHLTNYYLRRAEEDPNMMGEALECAKKTVIKAIEHSRETSEHFYVEDLARWYKAEIYQLEGNQEIAIIQLMDKAMEGLKNKLPPENCLVPKLQQKLNDLRKNFMSVASDDSATHETCESLAHYYVDEESTIIE